MRLIETRGPWHNITCPKCNLGYEDIDYDYEEDDYAVTCKCGCKFTVEKIVSTNYYILDK